MPGDRWCRYLCRELGLITEPGSSLHKGLEVMSAHLSSIVPVPCSLNLGRRYEYRSKPRLLRTLDTTA